MNRKDLKLTALQFNQSISEHDPDALKRLITDDYAFIESDGAIHQPKQVISENWKQFFKLFPEYRNTLERIQSKDNLVVIPWYAYWSEKQPHDPAIWTAIIINDLVREWHIYIDTPENRKKFNLV